MHDVGTVGVAAQQLVDATDAVGAFVPKVLDLAGLAPGRYQLLAEWEGASWRKSFVRR